MSWLLRLLGGGEGQVGAPVESRSWIPKLRDGVLASVVGDVALIEKWLDHELRPSVLLPHCEQLGLLAFYL